MQDYITQEGVEKLKSELDNLKNVRRKEVAERLRFAAAQGDLSENFDYSDAKEEQEQVERRIIEIETTLANAKVVEAPKANSDIVQIGSNVTLKNGAQGMSVTVTGAQEADPMNGMISAESPMGKALLGKKKGEKAKVETPNGEITYTVESIN